VDHARAGAYLLENWALPKDLGEVCERHHDAPKAGNSEVLQVVTAACAVADAIGFPAVQCRRQLSYADAALPLTPRPGRKALPPEERIAAPASPSDWRPSPANPADGFAYHASTMSDTPCSGKSNSTWMRPSTGAVHRGDSNN